MSVLADVRQGLPSSGGRAQIRGAAIPLSQEKQWHQTDIVELTPADDVPVELRR
jgi:hypothetical protein